MLIKNQIEMVRKNGFDIKKIKNPKVSVQLEAIKQNFYSIMHIDNPHPKAQYEAMKRCKYHYVEISLVETGKIQDEQVLQKFVKHNLELFVHIKNPSEQIQLIACSLFPSFISNIENPSEKVQLAAIMSNNRYGTHLSYIKNPSKMVQRISIRMFPHSMEFVKCDIKKKLQLIAVNKNPESIQFIKNPSEQVQLAAVRKMGCAIEFINNPSKRVCYNAIKNYPMSIVHIKDPCIEHQMLAIQMYPNVCEYIENLSESLKYVAIKKKGILIKLFNKQSHMTQLMCINQLMNQDFKFIAMDFFKFVNISDKAKVLFSYFFNNPIYILPQTQKIQCVLIQRFVYSRKYFCDTSNTKMKFLSKWYHKNMYD